MEKLVSFACNLHLIIFKNTEHQDFFVVVNLTFVTSRDTHVCSDFNQRENELMTCSILEGEDF